MSRGKCRRYAEPRGWDETDKRCLKLSALVSAWGALIVGAHLWLERP